SCTRIVFTLVLVFAGTPQVAVLAQEDAPSPKLPELWKSFERRVDQAIISRNGKIIAVQRRTSPPYATLHRRDTGEQIQKITRCFSDLFAFTPDNKRLLTQRGTRPKQGADRWEIDVWDLATAKISHSFELLPRHGVRRGLYGVSDKTLVVVGEDKMITTYDLTTGKLISDFDNKGHRPHYLALSPDGKWLLTAGEKNELRVWDVQKRKLLHELSDHDSPIEAIAISDDAKWCAWVTKEGASRRVWVFDREKATSCARTDLL